MTITDQAGRQVVIPAEIKTVFCTSPMGTNLMYMLAPEMMAGWNVTPTAIEKAYIPEQYRNYVGLGGWFGKGTTGNVEEIIKRAPSIVLSVGSHDASAVSEADRIQGLLNIPVVVVERHARGERSRRFATSASCSASRRGPRNSPPTATTSSPRPRPTRPSSPTRRRPGSTTPRAWRA